MIFQIKINPNVLCVPLDIIWTVMENVMKATQLIITIMEVLKADIY
jgi:hypothetical protein